jgi:hypothetical protein
MLCENHINIVRVNTRMTTANKETETYLSKQTADFSDLSVQWLHVSPKTISF